MFFCSLKFSKIWVGFVFFKWFFEKSGSVGRWETKQFIGMALPSFGELHVLSTGIIKAELQTDK